MIIVSTSYIILPSPQPESPVCHPSSYRNKYTHVHPTDGKIAIAGSQLTGKLWGGDLGVYEDVKEAGRRKKASAYSETPAGNAALQVCQPTAVSRGAAMNLMSSVGPCPHSSFLYLAPPFPRLHFLLLRTRYAACEKKWGLTG